jgi:hypothetical protein
VYLVGVDDGNAPVTSAEDDTSRPSGEIAGYKSGTAS